MWIKTIVLEWARGAGKSTTFGWFSKQSTMQPVFLWVRLTNKCCLGLYHLQRQVLCLGFMRALTMK
jgi:hypothetical protein